MRLINPWWTSPRGGAGWMATAGLAAGITVWWPLGVVAGGGWFALSMRGYLRSQRAMHHLAAAFPSAVHTTSELDGTIDGTQFVANNRIDYVHIRVATEIPEGVTIDRTPAKQAIGDPAFDREFRVGSDDDTSALAWRILLDAEHRAAFCEVFAGVSVELYGGWFDIWVGDTEAEGPKLERLIREASALGMRMSQRLQVANAYVAFVEQIGREPVAAVRFDHYRWLVSVEYEVPAILRLAAHDVDPEIRAWAQSQRPTETLYR